MDQKTVEVSRFKITPAMAEAIEEGQRRLAGVSRNDWLRIAIANQLRRQSIEVN